ncbi:hypothetical protein BJG94_08175 [Rhizobium sp. Td3]|nr:hypothetical protein [Rhizobium sp. RM]TMV20834.1 hypothetical protein BJG94_08175 [Rhizobium sp. Td3]
MRICVEANLRFREIFKVDAEEAINNVDRAFEMKLEGFHTLYDVSKNIFQYFDHADTTLMIVVRNAIHHRNHPLFRSLNQRLHIEKDIERSLGASFLLSDHKMATGGGISMSHYVRLDDIEARLDPSMKSPYLDQSVNSAKAAQRLKLINAQLNLSTIRKRTLQDRYSSDRVYLDLMPIFVSATIRVFSAMKAKGLRFKGFDAETYAVPFTSELAVDLSHLNFNRLWLRGFGPVDLVLIPLL